MKEYEEWSDPIIDELHQIRKRMMEEAGNDPKVFGERLMRQQEKHRDKLVDLRKRKLEKR